jgi:trans-aconitate methyltransferase
VKHWPMERVADVAIRSIDSQSLLVESAINRCEKLRRVLELETWIHEAQDAPLLARAAQRWQAEREQLLVELALPH